MFGWTKVKTPRQLLGTVRVVMKSGQEWTVNVYPPLDLKQFYWELLNRCSESKEPFLKLTSSLHVRTSEVEGLKMFEGTSGQPPNFGPG